MIDRWSTIGRIPGAVLALALVLTAACTPSTGGRPPAGYRDVDVAVVHEALQQGRVGKDFVILDVRTPAEYAAGHIAGATLLPVQSLAARLDEVPRDRPVYVHCQGGKRSARASRLLAGAGYTNIRNMRGGILAWRKARYPIVRLKQET